MTFKGLERCESWRTKREDTWDRVNAFWGESHGMRNTWETLECEMFVSNLSES